MDSSNTLSARMLSGHVLSGHMLFGGRCFALTASLLFVLLSSSSSAVAQPLQWLEGDALKFGGGARVSSGFFYDSTPPRHPSKREKTHLSLVGGVQAVLLLEQLFIPELSLAGEATLGAVHVAEHTLKRSGWAKGETSFNMGVDLVVRYYPIGTGTGPSVGASLGAEWIFFSHTTYTAFLPSVRLGWTTDLNGYLGRFELGYGTPIIAGITSPPLLTEEQKRQKPNKWSSRLHQFFFSMTVAF